MVAKSAGWAAKARGEPAAAVVGNKLEVPQWSMVELQGELLSKDKLSGQAIGSMTVDNGKPSLVISNHKLDGKVASEAKPLLVLRKVILADGDRGNETTDGSDSGGGGGEGSSGRRVSVAQPQQRQRQHRVQYQIVGKITNKTIFKTRPKPLIRKSGAPASSALSLQNKKV